MQNYANFDQTTPSFLLLTIRKLLSYYVTLVKINSQKYVTKICMHNTERYTYSAGQYMSADSKIWLKLISRHADNVQENILFGFRNYF